MTSLLSHDYDTINYQPAAPFIEITIDGYDDTKQPLTLKVFVDSGADGTMLPRDILLAVGATYKGTAILSGMAGGRQTVDQFIIRIQIGSHIINGISVVAMPTNSEAIVGRDVLNELILTLNGPSNTVQIEVE